MTYETATDHLLEARSRLLTAKTRAQRVEAEADVEFFGKKAAFLQPEPVPAWTPDEDYELEARRHINRRVWGE